MALFRLYIGYFMADLNGLCPYMSVGHDLGPSMIRRIESIYH